MRSAGFTLLEVLLSITAISIIAGIGIPVYQSFQNRNELSIAATTFAQTMRRAQVLSQAVDGDTTWGVHVANGSITLFRGASYVARNGTYDEVTTMPTSITTSGVQDYVFSKLTGDPQAIGTLTLTSSNNEVITLTTNEKGMVAY